MIMSKKLSIETKTKAGNYEQKRRVEIDIDHWTFSEKIKFLRIVLGVDEKGA